jgi:hypothetical protein
VITISSRIRGRGGSIGNRLLRLISILSISIVDLLADLLGEGQLNILAGRGSQGSDTLLKGLRDSLNLRNSDALLLRQVLTADSGEEDGLVDTGLDWLRVDNIDSRLNNSEDRDIVASLLGNLLAVVVAVAVISISRGRLAHSNHLGVTLLLEGNLNSLGSSSLSLGLVRVGADLIVNLLNALRAHSPGDCVALFSINHILAGKLNRVAHSLEGRGANFSGLNNIQNCAVMLGLFIPMVGRLVVDRGRLVVDRGWLVVDRGRFVGRGMDNWGMVGYDWGGMDSVSYNRCSMCNSMWCPNVRESSEGDSSLTSNQGDKGNQSKDL